MRATAPNGSPILGTLETVTARAEIADGSFYRKPDGSLGFEWGGETKVFWDDQETVWRDGQAIYLAADGSEVPENEIVLVGEDQKQENADAK